MTGSSRRRSLPLAGAFTVAALVLSTAGCSGSSGAGGRPSPSSRPSSPPAMLSARAASRVFTRGVESLASGTAHFSWRAQLGSGGGSTTTTTTGVFDASRPAWSATVTVREPEHAPIGPLQFAGSNGSLFVHSPAWTGRLAGRWLGYTSADLAKATSESAGFSGSSITVPEPVAALSAARSAEAARTVDGYDVRVTVPAVTAVSLAGLKSGVTRLGVDPSSLHGRIPMSVTIDPDGHIVTMTLAAGSLTAIGDQLPRLLQLASQQAWAGVRFSHWGEPVHLTIPRPADVVSASKELAKQTR